VLKASGNIPLKEFLGPFMQKKRKFWEFETETPTLALAFAQS